MEEFIELIMRNLNKNGFPERRVSFDMEKLYELAEDRRISLNNVLDHMKTQGVDHDKKGDKIIFKVSAPQQPDFSGLPPDFLAQAQAMMGSMSEDELDATRAMVQERLGAMNEQERDQLFAQIKGMGLS